MEVGNTAGCTMQYLYSLVPGKGIINLYNVIMKLPDYRAHQLHQLHSAITAKTLRRTTPYIIIIIV